MAGEFHICGAPRFGGCHQRVDPATEKLVTAYEQADVTAAGDQTKQYIDGIGIYYHPGCSPGDQPGRLRRG
jgi:hypothetical protein